MFDRVATAILLTLYYADLFDYPLTHEEIQRYLIGVRATRAEIFAALDDHARLNGQVARVGGWLTLPQRENLIADRARLRAAAARQLPRARFYARLIAHFPFVRMIALTGALAMQNARDGDIDLFIVTAPQRLWLTRALIIALVRLARIFGDKLCPNFLLTENSLEIFERNLYTAHEIAQMIPLVGFRIYQRFRDLNQWSDAFLPNAADIARFDAEAPLTRGGRALKTVAERALGGNFGDALERWERMRKIAKLDSQRHGARDGDTAQFTADICRGFLNGHSQRVLRQFNDRITSSNLEFRI